MNEERRLERENLPGVRRILFAFALIAVVLCLSLVATQPPSPKPAGAPANEFSGQRARDFLLRLVGDGVPHPIGSPQNDVIRQRIVDVLSGLGYIPQVQTAFECDEYGTCGTVKNVLARLEGTDKSASVLLVAHYDSVPAGPGASDDGAGVAALLETARALKALPSTRNSVIVMIDDGEEAGLLGARAFVDFHPWAKEVFAAVNLEARGTSGSSLMFETGKANAWAVGLFARHASRPATNSIAYAVYKMLPNDTDFTVFKAAGYQGLNFAYIGDVTHYHTPLDNFQSADPASIQHHGENAMAAIEALTDVDIRNPAQGEAVYFDIFGRWIGRWPARRSLPAGIFALLLIAGETFWLIRSERLAWKGVFWGILAWAMAMLATTVLSLIVVRVIRLAGALPLDWVAHPIALQVAMWSLALSLLIAHGFAFQKRTGFWGLWTGTWLSIATLGVVSAAVTPGFSYVPLASSWAAGLSALLFVPRSRNESNMAFPVIVPLLATGVTGFGLALTMYNTLGARSLSPLAIEVAFLLSPILPACVGLDRAKPSHRTAILVAPILMTILAAFAASLAPAVSTSAPERLNIEYWLDSDSARAQWIVDADSGRLPEQMRVAAHFRRIERGPFPWNRGPAFLADAPRLPLPAPTFTILESSLEGNKHLYRMLLRSERAAPGAMVLFPPNSGIESVRMEDFAIPPQSERLKKYLNGWALYRCETVPAKGVTLSFTLPAEKPVEVYAVDRTFHLPDDGNFLLKTRPLVATPSQDGDVTLVSRRIQLIP